MPHLLLSVQSLYVAFYEENLEGAGWGTWISGGVGRWGGEAEPH